MSNQEEAELFFKQARQRYRDAVNVVVQDWKNGTVIPKLEALSTGSDQAWLSEYVDAATKFYRGENFSRTLEIISKLKVGDNNELEEFYVSLFSEYSLLMNTVALSVNDSFEEPDYNNLLLLRVDNDKDPEIVRICDNLIIPLTYVAGRLEEYVREATIEKEMRCIGQRYFGSAIAVAEKSPLLSHLAEHLVYPFLTERVGNRAEKNLRSDLAALSQKEFLTYAKAFHFSLPLLDKTNFLGNLGLKKTEDSFRLYLSSQEK